MTESDGAGLRIAEDDLTGNDIQALLRLHAEAMLENSPPGACHFLPIDALRDPSITVWSAWDGGRLAGCGALRQLDPRHGEIKSMRTAPTHLGLGVGRAVLGHIIEVARVRGYERLSLETGSGHAFVPAVHLYRSVGFEPCGPFGDYTDGDFSQFFALDLRSVSA